VPVSDDFLGDRARSKRVFWFVALLDSRHHHHHSWWNFEVNHGKQLEKK